MSAIQPHAIPRGGTHFFLIPLCLPMGVAFLTRKSSRLPPSMRSNMQKGGVSSVLAAMRATMLGCARSWWILTSCMKSLYCMVVGPQPSLRNLTATGIPLKLALWTVPQLPEAKYPLISSSDLSGTYLPITRFGIPCMLMSPSFRQLCWLGPSCSHPAAGGAIPWLEIDLPDLSVMDKSAAAAMGVVIPPPSPLGPPSPPPDRLAQQS
mmetsp:Transcript_5886/g.14932  ORF Transcript_5886/g.14932 Transcript_5886/m.14932 type:complete len:208 (-) Transcript_5886:23-646(-)